MILYPKSSDLLYLNVSTTSEDELRALDSFAVRIQSMLPIYVYQLSKEALWSACKSGWTVRTVIEFIRYHSATPIPHVMQTHVMSLMQRYGKLQLVRNEHGQECIAGDASVLQEIRRLRDIKPLLLGGGGGEAGLLRLRDDAAWTAKLSLSKLGYPVIDLTINNEVNHPVNLSLKSDMQLRLYQRDAVNCYINSRESGVMVLPCGSGKTIIGVAITATMQQRTLILVPGEAAAQQWYQHICTWTTIKTEDVCVDDGKGSLASITITTYQRLTARRRNGVYHQFSRYTKCEWGLVIYDEVHLLPAPLFRLCAMLKTNRALGLSATLVREDERTTDVFALVGRKMFEVFAEDLTRDGYLAHVRCIEVKVPLSVEGRMNYESASARERHRLAADNSMKFAVLQHLCNIHQDRQILVMGHYTNFLKEVSSRLNCPMLDGEASKQARLETYRLFRDGQISVLVLSRIANMAVDLPNADVAIQVSGLFGSRQEEAQRLGRLLRPNQHQQGTCGMFYSLVSDQTVEEKTARHRARYLVEHGFAYDWTTADEMMQKGADQIETNRMSQPRFRQDVALHRK